MVSKRVHFALPTYSQQRVYREIIRYVVIFQSLIWFGGRGGRGFLTLHCLYVSTTNKSQKVANLCFPTKTQQDMQQCFASKGENQVL